MRVRVLVVENGGRDGVIERAVKAEGFVVRVAGWPDAAIAALGEIDSPLAVVDWHVSGRGRVADVLTFLARRHPATVVIVVSPRLGDPAIRHSITSAHPGALLHDWQSSVPDTLRLRIRSTVGQPFGDLVVRNGVVVHMPCGGAFSHTVAAQLVAGHGRPVLVRRNTGSAQAAWRFQQFLGRHGSPMAVVADHSGYRHLVDTRTLSGCAATRHAPST